MMVDEAKATSKIKDVQVDHLEVLVVDDNEVNLNFIKNSLTYYVIDADTATSGIL